MQGGTGWALSEPYKMTSRRPLVWMSQTIRNRLHEGCLRAWRPLVGPVLTGRHRGARLAFALEHQNWQVRHWHPVLFTDESRFTLSTCDRCERVWRSRGERYAAWNICLVQIPTLAVFALWLLTKCYKNVGVFFFYKIKTKRLSKLREPIFRT